MTEYVYAVGNMLRVVDGDTYDLTIYKDIDFGFYLIERKHWTARFRLFGVDTWEAREAGGSAATTAAEEWILSAVLDGVCEGQTFKTDNFGRWLIDLYRTDTKEHLSEHLRAGGHTKS